MRESLYLYGFVPAGTSLPAGGLSGLEGGAVAIEELDGFSAVVGRVPADTFAPAALERRFEDLEWIAERGVEHEAVVAWFVDHAEILPVRLFTLYSGPDALAREAGERASEIRETLERFRGLREWDLRIGYDEGRLRSNLDRLSDEVAELDAEIEAASPGRRFLLEKRRGSIVEREVRETARRLGRDTASAVAEHAIERKSIAPPREAGAPPVVLNLALLLSSEGAQRARAEAERRAEDLAPLGIELQLTGPWAPYRFLEADDDE